MHIAAQVVKLRMALVLVRSLFLRTLTNAAQIITTIFAKLGCVVLLLGENICSAHTAKLTAIDTVVTLPRTVQTAVN